MTQHVAIGIIQQHHSLLVGKRKAEPFSGKWEFPGGKVESNETSREALVREFREEGKQEIKITALWGNTPVENSNPPTLLHFYWIEPIGQFDPQIYDEIQWIEIDRLTELDWIDTNRCVLPMIQQLLTHDFPLVTNTVFHTDNPANLKMTLANIANLMNDMSVMKNQIELVVNGPAIECLKQGSDFSDQLLESINCDTEIWACRNAMAAHDISESQLIPGIKPVSSGVGRLTLRQAQGFGYIKP